MKLRKTLLLLCVLLFGYVGLMGQNKFVPDKFRLSLQTGNVFATNSFLKGQNNQQEVIKGFSSLSLSIGKQTTGKKPWQEIYKNPFIGGGIYIASFGENTSEIGVPIVLFGFFSAPFVRGKKLSFNYDLQLGMAFNWKPFNPISNPNNISIGGRESFYVDIGAFLNYKLSNQLTMDVGFSVSHFSNGALKKPNLGLNTIAPKLSLAYQIENKETNSVKPETTLQKKGKSETYASLFVGFTNIVFDSLQLDIIEKYEGVTFPTYGLTTGINKRISRKSKIGIGISTEYHTAYHAIISVAENEIVIGKIPPGKKLALSIFPSYELVIDRLSILVQPGYYLYRSKLNDNNPRFYQRVGIKYYVHKNCFVGFNLRAFDYHVSDFIEWNVGWQLNWNKKV